MVFYQAPNNFGSNASVYMWIKNTETALVGAWPGASATHLGNGKFKFTIPSNVTGDESKWMIIWNNNNNGVQTGDFDFHMRGLYDNGGYKGLVTTLCEGGDTGETPETPDTPDTPAEGITVKAKVPANWGSTISAWVWGDGMESHWATVTKEGQWYVVTENATKFNIIFVNGSDWNGDANQTVDMEGITENTCFQLNQSGGGKVQYTIIDCETSDTPDTPDTPQETEMCLNSADERAVFYQGSNFGTSVYVYMWDPTNGDTKLTGEWPGTAATNLGDGKFKFVVPASATGEPSNWKIIWNNGNGGEGNQTADLAFTMHGIYNFSGCNGTVTALCDGGENPETAVEDVEINQPQARKILYNGALYLIMPNGDIYNAAGVLVNK